MMAERFKAQNAAAYVRILFVLLVPAIGQAQERTPVGDSSIHGNTEAPPPQPAAAFPDAWSQPIRIAQVGQPAAPVPSGPAAAPQPSGTLGAPPPYAIQPVMPGAGQVRRDYAYPQDALPFQAQIPQELLPRLDDPDAKKQADRFIPKIIDPQQELNLLVGQPRILTFAEWATKPQVRLYLPDESIARWDIISDTEVAIVGLAPGNTVLTIWFNDPAVEGGKRVLSFRVRVFEDPQVRETVTDLEKQINELFPDSHIKLSLAQSRLVVRGQAKDAIEAGQILSVLAQTRNRGGVGRPQTPDYQDATVTNLFTNRDAFEQEEDAALRRSVFDPTAAAQAGIINLLSIPGEQQVTLRVTLAEVNRSALRSIGANVQIGGSGDVSFVSLLLPNGFAAGTGGNLSVNATDFRLALNALRDLGYARTLAEPNLTAINGRPANFRAGDTFPVPNAVAGFGGVGQSVTQQFVGVQVQFIPYIVDRDRIRLQVSGQISARDDAQGANVGGTNVPGQVTRDFTTTVELREGQTMALAGLLQTTLAGDSRRVPFLGDIPLLGTLFSIKNNSATEQELVFLVTPELAHPLESSEVPPLPGSDVFEPTDCELFLKNRMESRRTQDFRSPVRTDYHRLKHVERFGTDRYIIGPNGYSGTTTPTYSPPQYSTRPAETLPAPPRPDPPPR
jgi:pilus assembly protein CpaC